jgi:hypothetical protein
MCQNPTPRSVYREVLDSQLPEYESESESVIEALKTVIASFVVGPLDSDISELTGVRLARVTEIGDVLRKFNIWDHEKVYFDVEETDDGLAWTVQIALHVLVANGHLIRIDDDIDQPSM